MTVPRGVRRGRRLQLQHFGLQRHHLEQVIDAGAFGRGNRTARSCRRPNPPARGRFSCSCFFTLSMFAPGRSILLIATMIFTLRRLGVIDRLDRLRHEAVVRGDDEHDDVRDIRAAGAHGREGCVARRIEKSDRRALCIDAVGADVLRDAAGFARRDARLANRVHQRGLAVIDVAHERDDRRARLEFFFLRDDRRRRRDHHLLRPCGRRRLFRGVPFPRTKPWFSAILRRDIRLDRLVDVGENVDLHQLGDELMRLQAKLRGQFLDDDRRLDG